MVYFALWWPRPGCQHSSHISVLGKLCIFGDRPCWLAHYLKILPSLKKYLLKNVFAVKSAGVKLEIPAVNEHAQCWKVPAPNTVLRIGMLEYSALKWTIHITPSQAQGEGDRLWNPEDGEEHCNLSWLWHAFASRTHGSSDHLQKTWKQGQLSGKKEACRHRGG